MTKRRDLVLVVQKLLGSKDSKRLAESIAAYLLETRQSKNLGAILRDIETVRFNQDGILEVHVASARSLSEATLKSIKALFDAKHIIIHEEQDPSLLGGVKVRAHDQRLDYSVRTRLQRLRGGV
jgi:F-type H+-transporting ATPase subunit delta